VLKSSEHFFFRLSDRNASVPQALDRDPGASAAGDQQGEEWLRARRQGAFRLGHSRDPPYFGIRVPDIAEEKYLYVWLDAPIGYFASLKNYCARRPRF